ncbi:MAG: sigma-70 family RNA polymerase sigma factor [Planctomycetota bacterium]
MSDPIIDLVVPTDADDSERTAAFDALFQHFHPRLVRFLSKTLHGTSIDPDDVAQETMVKAWTKRDQFDPRYQFSTWVYTIARRTATDHLRKHNRDESSDQLDTVARTDLSPEQSLISDEATESVWSTAERILPTRQYSVLWLRYGEEMSIKEVSRTLSMTNVTVRVLLHRARAALQARMEMEARKDESHGELTS